MAPHPRAESLRAASDETVSLPLWDFSPEMRKDVLHERRVRFQNVEEEIGDPEYS